MSISCKSEIKKTYASVSQEPERDFIFPTGRAWAEDLGYPPELGERARDGRRVVRRRRQPLGSSAGLQPGERVLDLGSGAGTDSLDRRPDGRRAGPGYRDRHDTGDARQGAHRRRRDGLTNVEFVESEAEQLPFPDGSFDVVISNGVIDLIPDKDAVFAEIFRVLIPGGRIQIADVTIQNPVSAEGRRNIDLWTG